MSTTHSGDTEDSFAAYRYRCELAVDRLLSWLGEIDRHLEAIDRLLLVIQPNEHPGRMIRVLWRTRYHEEATPDGPVRYAIRTPAIGRKTVVRTPKGTTFPRHRVIKHPRKAGGVHGEFGAVLPEVKTLMLAAADLLETRGELVDRLFRFPSSVKRRAETMERLLSSSGSSLSAVVDSAQRRGHQVSLGSLFETSSESSDKVESS